MRLVERAARRRRGGCGGVTEAERAGHEHCGAERPVERVLCARGLHGEARLGRARVGRRAAVGSVHCAHSELASK